MTTARTLITRALRKAGVLARGETPTAEEANDGLTELNSMLGMWSNDNLLVYARTLENFNLSANDAEYTIGTGADFNTARPLFIASAYIREATTDYPVEVISEEAYAAIPDKSQIGVPQALTYDNAYPIGKIRFSALPAAAYVLWLLSEKELSSIATLDTAISLPPGYEDAIVYNLVLRFFAEYGGEPDALTLKLAGDGKALIERTTNRNRPMTWGAPKNRGNVLTGWWA